MTQQRLWGDTQGAVLVEVSITISLFLALTFGVIQVGFLMWILSALQHGAEMAARCASASVVRHGFETPGCACSGGQG